MNKEYTMEDVDKICKAYDLKLYLFQKELLKSILNKKELITINPYQVERMSRIKPIDYYYKILRNIDY